MIELLGFAPDADPTVPGVITDCDGIVPYESGMRAASTPLDVGYAALAAECRGSGVTRDLNGNSRLFAGTTSNLYEGASSTWSSVGSGYSLGTDDRWKFAAFGSTALAVNPSVTLQRSTSGAFSAVGGAPKAKAIVSAKGFVMLLCTDAGADVWHCSEYLNETGWTPSISTQCATGRLVEGSGPITAGLRLGDNVVAYKERVIFVGQYVGGDAVWQWSPPIGDVGCIGPDAVVDTPIGHVFAGSDNIYVFDGTRPVPIATDVVRQWWLNNSSPKYRYRTKLLWDRDNNLVFIFFPTLSSSTCDQAIVYHVLAKKWGKVTISVEAVLNYTSGGFTYDAGTPLVTTYDATTNPSASYDSPFWLDSKSSPGAFKTDHKIYTLTGDATASWFTTGDYGDESSDFDCNQFRIRYAQKPSASTCVGLTRESSGAALAEGSSGSFDGSKFPLRQCARFHRFTVTMLGNAKVTGIDPKLQQAGSR